MTRAGAISSAFRLRGPVVLLSILLHFAVLLPIGLAVPRLMRPDQPVDYQTLPLDLTPIPFPRSLRPADASRRPRGAASAATPAIRPRIPLALPTDSTAPSPPADGPVIDERWRVGPRDPSASNGPMGRVARIPCPAAAGDRLGQRVCMTGSAMHSPDMQERTADLRRAGPDGLEQTREEGFERQRQANEAWRDYTRGEGAYPGLRSLFSER